LNAVGPSWDIEIMRFIHQSEDSFCGAVIFGCQLSPEICELGIRWPTLTNYLPIETGEIMDINGAIGSSLETGLHELIIIAKVFGVEWASHYIVDEVLPRDGYIGLAKSKDKEVNIDVRKRKMFIKSSLTKCAI